MSLSLMGPGARCQTRLCGGHGVNLTELVPQELSVSILRGSHRMSKTLSHLSPPLIPERSISSLRSVKLVTCSWERLRSMSIERSGISGARMRESQELIEIIVIGATRIARHQARRTKRRP